jgi:hypothetical protein
MYSMEPKYSIQIDTCKKIYEQTFMYEHQVVIGCISLHTNHNFFNQNSTCTIDLAKVQITH